MKDIYVYFLFFQLILQIIFGCRQFNLYSLMCNMLLAYVYTTRIMVLPYVGLILLGMLNNSYLGQDIILFPLTVIGYLFVHLDKLQTTAITSKAYLDIQSPVLTKNEQVNIWYQYNNFQIGDMTYYLWMNTSSKFEPTIKLWFYYCNNKTKEKYQYIEHFSKTQYKTYKKGNMYVSECATDTIAYYFSVDEYKNEYIIRFKNPNVELTYNGVIEVNSLQCMGAIFPFSLLSYVHAPADGQVTDVWHERMNDVMFVTVGSATVNGNVFKNCSAWQDSQIGVNNYFMTTWLWIYQVSESFIVYNLWYSDPEYYNNPDTMKVSYVYDRKNKKTMMNGCSFMTPMFKKITGFVEMNVDTCGTSVKESEFDYKYTIKTQSFDMYVESIKGTSIKVFDDKYMYDRINKDIDYGDMDELMSVAEEIRYDEFSNQSIIYANYNGKQYKEHAQSVIDSMTWKYGWPSNYKKRNESFFNKTFYLEKPNNNELNGRKS
jgi:hypothetical protein